jgi:hypothetical protein
LSAIERGCLLPSDDEVARLTVAIDQLASVRDRVRDYAAELGCPELF